jgi:hypothetical protein
MCAEFATAQQQTVNKNVAGRLLAAARVMSAVATASTHAEALAIATLCLPKLGKETNVRICPERVIYAMFLSSACRLT